MLRAAASVFTLLRRDVFAVPFFLASLTGIRAFVPGLVAFGVVVANFTFSRYDEELAAAAEGRLSSLLPSNDCPASAIFTQQSWAFLRLFRVVRVDRWAFSPLGKADGVPRKRPRPRR